MKYLGDGMYRYEKKFLINNIQMELLKNNLSAALYLDKNIKNDDGSYFIRSVYFDDYKDTSYNQVIDGISKREKYRIRYYDYDPSYITLEKKSKVNNLGKKDKDTLTREMTEKIIKGEEVITDKTVVNELQRVMKSRFYRPVIIIDYNRRAFTYPINDVRITIDYNISCSYETDKFFDKDINSIPLLEKNTAILEVKYNDFLPDVIKRVINIKNMEVTSFSKYSTGRDMLQKIERRV